MKAVIQLDQNGYFVGQAFADESPLEPGVYLLPGNTVEATMPNIPDGHVAKWNGSWVYEELPQPEPAPAPVELTYADKRAMEYPLVTDYLDGIVKGDQAQIDAYIAACLAVKAKYPKEAQ